MSAFQKVAVRMTTYIVTCMLLATSTFSAAQDIATGSPMSDQIRFQLGIYYLPIAEVDPVASLRLALTKSDSATRWVEQLPDVPSQGLVSAHLLSNVQEAYAPPDLASLQYFGRGLTAEQAQILQSSTQALVIDFAHPKEAIWDALRTAYEIVEITARETNGLIWDEESREVFTPDQWRSSRIEAWTETVPDLSAHTVIHAYRSGEFVRAISLGMGKFGLPDVVIENFTWSNNTQMGHLINLLIQAMAEGATIENAGRVDLDIRAIGNDKVRASMLETVYPNSSKVAELHLKKGVWETGDPYNRLIEITFDRYPGRDVHARHESLVSSLFGWEDPVSYVKHNAKLVAASEQARTHLPGLYKAFTKGLKPGEFIQLKAPFATPDGAREWMWVEVISWEGDKIKGLLKNEPYNIPSLHGGQVVEISQSDVFDYIRRDAEGNEEGNATGAIIAEMQ